jgi:hypothetical protein
MHAACGRIHHLRQLVGVRALELGERAVFEQTLWQGIVFGQLGQDFLVGRRGARGRLLHYRQPLLREENVGELPGRIEVEGLAGERVGFSLDFHQAAAKHVALLRQHCPVDEYPGTLHSIENFRHRQFDVAVEGLEPCLFPESRRQRLMHAQGDIGILGSIGGGAFDIHLGERNAVRALAGNVIVANGLQPEMPRGE